MSRIIFLFVLYLFVSVSCYAQEAAVYNINNYNGLSSNHVYNTHVDKNGYLWISTTDGVFRYNGYTLRKYDYKDGLPNVDVWDIYEDKQNRLWLLSIANGIGYIKNNTYHQLVVKNDSITNVIYPGSLIEKDSIIIFDNKQLNNSNSYSYAIIKSDTVELKTISANVFKLKAYITPEAFILADTILYYYPLEVLTHEDGMNKPIRTEKSVINHLTGLTEYTIVRNFWDNFYYANPKSNYIYFWNYKNNTEKKLLIDSADSVQIIHVSITRDNLYVLTNHYALQIDRHLNITGKYPYNSFFKKDNTQAFNAVYFINNTFWGKCLSTSDRGLYIDFSTSKVFHKLDIDLSEYRNVGNLNDSTAYWWNESKNSLTLIQNGIIVKSTLLKDVFNVRKIIPYNDQKALLMCNKNLKWLYRNGEVKDFVNNITTIIHNDTAHKINTHIMYFYYSVASGVISNDADFYMIGTGFLGLFHIKADYSNNTIYSTTIDNIRYDNIFYDNNGNIIANSGDRICVHNIKTGRNIVIGPKHLKAINIRNIQKMNSDIYGNIIIKDYDKILLFNPLNKKTSSLLDNINFKGAVFDIQKNILTIAGNFGVIRCTTGRNGNISGVKTYPNTKNLFYKYIYDIQVSENNILLNTDNGVYMVNTAGLNVHTTTDDKFRIILANDTALHNLGSKDTLAVLQTTNTIGIDVIKPTGTGNLNIEYSINRQEYTNTGYQVILPIFEPGSYHSISVIASDDSWKSKPVKFIIYIQPEWWQTSTAKQIIFTLSILFIIGLIYIIVIVTRRIVNSSNERRNQRRELELKSIYSQINPHFIFNSLSTAQYFVKKNKNKEAFEHINQFSDLLRSYIKSSRNKYITIDEEIENLENYLHLQLTRFEEKFDYSIQVDESVDSKTVKIPSLLLQPIVENALNHGIFHSETKGLLNISFAINKDNKNELICVVDDDGIGRKKSRELRSEQIRKADSYGTILIKELVDTFNKYEKIQIEIEYIDKVEPDNGTTVIIRINDFTNAR